MNEEKAFEAYKQLASYLQEKDCYPREKKCPDCIFYMHYYTCLIHRLGNYPELALREEDIKEINENIRKKNENNKKLENR